LSSGCREPLGRQECEKLVDKYIELLTRQGSVPPQSDEVLRRQAEARMRFADDPKFLDCAGHVSRSAYECAMHSSTPDVFEQCLL
jgi:hypothetical protein